MSDYEFRVRSYLACCREAAAELIRQAYRQVTGSSEERSRNG